MSTAPQRILSGAELRALSARSDARGAVRISVHVLLLAGSGWLVAQSGPATVWPALLLLGVIQATLFAPVHETMHLTAFRSRGANAIVGWLVSCPSLINWHYYTAFHLAHHRFTQDPSHDPELASPPPDALGGYVARILGVPYWRLRFRVIIDCWRGDLSRHPWVPSIAVLRIIRSVRAMSLLMVAGAIGSALIWGWRTPFLYWIVPQMIGQPLLRAYLLTEHTLCTNDANGLTNTRTTLTNSVVHLLMWNMPFHAEHHLYPSIPFHRLRAAHSRLGERLGVVQPGYVRWHRDFVRGLRRRPSVLSPAP